MKKTKLKAGILVKIITPILILAVIGGIWIYKNANTGADELNTPMLQNNSSAAESKGDSSGDKALNEDKKDDSSSDIALNEDNKDDFALEAASIDLEKLKSYGIPIIIDFGADSCIPCKEMAPVLKKLNAELQGRVIVKFVDVWKNQKAATNFPVEVIPTQFFFDKDGKPYVPSDPEKMQMRMYSMKDTGEHVYTAHQGGMTEAHIMEVLNEMGVY